MRPSASARALRRERRGAGHKNPPPGTGTGDPPPPTGRSHAGPRAPCNARLKSCAPHGAKTRQGHGPDTPHACEPGAHPTARSPATPAVHPPARTGGPNHLPAISQASRSNIATRPHKAQKTRRGGSQSAAHGAPAKHLQRPPRAPPARSPSAEVFTCFRVLASPAPGRGRGAKGPALVAWQPTLKKANERRRRAVGDAPAREGNQKRWARRCCTKESPPTAAARTKVSMRRCPLGSEDGGRHMPRQESVEIELC